MKFINIKYIIILICLITISTGCTKNEITYHDTTENESSNNYSELLNYVDALEILKEDTVAEVYDIETGISYNIRRVTGGFNTLGDIETLTKEDTEKMLETTGGNFTIVRRAIIVTVGDVKIAASLSPFPHSGSEDYPYAEIIDNRSGSTGTGINLDYIRGNGMIGVCDIYFYNSLTPGINRVDERHQEMVLEAYAYEG